MTTTDETRPWARQAGEQMPSAEEVERCRAARRFVHRMVCVPRLGQRGDDCPACPTATGTIRALRILDARPRNARGARRALHDVVCMSGCGPESDHADRTQTPVAAALRKFRAAEAEADQSGGPS